MKNKRIKSRRHQKQLKVVVFVLEIGMYIEMPNQNTGYHTDMARKHSEYLYFISLILINLKYIQSN